MQHEPGHLHRTAPLATPLPQPFLSPLLCRRDVEGMLGLCSVKEALLFGHLTTDMCYSSCKKLSKRSVPLACVAYSSLGLTPPVPVSNPAPRGRPVVALRGCCCTSTDKQSNRHVIHSNNAARYFDAHQAKSGQVSSESTTRSNTSVLPVKLQDAPSRV
jgi:hypothetical protein